MIELDTHELAWCAGFFDGEGSIGKPSISDRSNSPIIQIGQKLLGPLTRFKNAVGCGNINYYNHKRAVKGRDEYYYHYRITNFEHSQHVMCLLWNWLEPTKKEKYKAIVNYYISTHIKNNYSINKKAIDARLRWHFGSKAMMLKNKKYKNSLLPEKEFINPFSDKKL